MKLFKKLATLALALTLCAGIGAFAACDNGETGSSASSTTSEATNTASAYKFKILNKDGSPAVGYGIQLCTYKADGVTLDQCYAPVTADENGQVSYDKAPAEGVYEIHVLDGTNQPVEFTGDVTKTPATYNTDDIVLTLK